MNGPDERARAGRWSEERSMAEKMLKFVQTARDMPAKRMASERAKDFDEIYQEYAGQKAAEQSSRCSQCGVPFWQVHSPLQHNIPDWLRLTSEGPLAEAYEQSSHNNSFPQL